MSTVLLSRTETNRYLPTPLKLGIVPEVGRQYKLDGFFQEAISEQFGLLPPDTVECVQTFIPGHLTPLKEGNLIVGWDFTEESPAKFSCPLSRFHHGRLSAFNLSRARLRLIAKRAMALELAEEVTRQAKEAKETKKRVAKSTKVKEKEELTRQEIAAFLSGI